ncbi:hypothetical protein FKP32DRAFT_1587621 [Trametes sanguinea]|nr:hypothetical protein FKP32DRAFT_1587621 [Trametes sanguinea]
MWTDEPLPIAGPVAGPSKPRKRRNAKRDAAPVPSEPTLVFDEAPLPIAEPAPAPPYSAVPYAGGKG